MITLRASSIFALAALTVATCFASGSKKGHEQFLLALSDPTSNLAAITVRGIGHIVGTDPASHMLIVQPDDSVSTDSAIAFLKKKSGVKMVLPMSARTADKDSLRSLNDHVRYMDAVEAATEPKEETLDVQGTSKHRAPRRDKADFYAAMRYYLQTHVAAGQDHIDQRAIRAGFSHANMMPKVTLNGKPVGAPSSVGTSGTFAFLGPNNLNIPYQQYFGVAPVAGRVTCIAYDPTNANTIYTGSGGGGLWKSTTGGATWACISDKSPWIYGAVDTIAIDPTNHNTLYVGTGDFDGFFDSYDQGIMKSTDGGVTWTNQATAVPGIYNMTVSHIVIDPTNTQIITCTTGRGSYNGRNEGTGGIYRSINGGASWSPVEVSTTDYCALDISIPGTNNVRTYWAAGRSVGGVGAPVLYKSVNQGATWTAVTPPDAFPEVAWSIATSKVSATTVYAICTGSIGNPATSYDYKVYKSTNSGASWTNITHGPMSGTANWGQADYDYFIGTYKAAQAPAGEVIFCGLLSVDYSVDGGTTWVDYGLSYATNTRIHSDQHQFAVSPSDPSQVLVGSDGGLYKISISWTGATPALTLASLNADLGITQFYKIAPHATNSNYVLGGAQDNASPSAFGYYTSWPNLQGGDGGYCGWDYPLDLLFTTSDQGGFFTYDLTGHNMNEPSNDSIPAAVFIAPTVISNDGKTAYIGADVMYTIDLTQTNLTETAGTVPITGGTGASNAIAIAKTDGNRIYSGGTDGSVFVSTDGNTSWTQIDGGTLSQASVGAIAVQPANANDILVGFQNTGVVHLYRCQNPTAANPTWTNVSGSGITGLPDVPLSAIVLSPFTPTTTWYVGTDVGVFVTTNSGATWANVSAGLPNVNVDDLKYGNGYLYAGTFGRGLWRAPLDGIVSFTINPATVVGGANSDGIVDVITRSVAPGEIVNLSSNSPYATVQPAVRVTTGGGSNSFPIETKAVTTRTVVTITATCGTSVVSKTLTLMPAP